MPKSQHDFIGIIEIIPGNPAVDIGAEAMRPFELNGGLISKGEGSGRDEARGKQVVFSVAIVTTVPHSIAVSKLRRPFLSDRYFFIVVRLLRRREKFTEADFALLARGFNRARALHLFYLSP